MRLIAIVLLVTLAIPGCSQPEDTSDQATVEQNVVPDQAPSNLPTEQIASQPLPLDDLLDTANNEPTREENDALGEQLRSGVTLPGPLTFASGSAEMTASSTQTIRRLGQRALQLLAPSETILVEGFVDETGTAEDNLELSSRRAEAIAQELLAANPDLDGRIRTVGHGEDHLLDPSCRGACETNRVVIITIVNG